MGDQDKEIAKAVIAVLSDRKGFDWWWDDLDEEIKADILESLRSKIAEVIQNG